jgi:hypothetical protein
VLALLPAAAFGAGVLLGDDARSQSAPGPARWSPPPAHLVVAAPAPALPSAARAVPARPRRAAAPAERSSSTAPRGSAGTTEPFLGTDAFVP